MTTERERALDQAFVRARDAMKRGDWASAMEQLERAHILGQREVIAHTRAHGLMLVVGWKTADWREVAGQLPRILASLLFSRIWVPLGNTGRARVSAIRPMPISAELRRLIERR